MKSKLATAIISFVIMLIISVFALFGLILWQELQTTEVVIEPEEFETEAFSMENTIDENIKTPNVIEKTENPFDVIKNNSNNDVDYSNVEIDKFFYNQLDEYSKTIYKAFESNKENMKSGTYQVELGSSFSSLLSKDNGQELLGDYYQSAIEAYTYDNPDVFYLSPNKMYLNIETTTKGNKITYNVFVNSGTQTNYLIDEFSSQEQVDIALNRIENIRDNILQNATGNTYEDIKMVHDYLINNIEYDRSISKDNIYNIYGALVNGESVCEGYARSFKYLMDNLDIPCTLVIGKGINADGNTENHAWNYVELEGTWYAVDCTWDDPIIVGTGWISPNTKYKYFLKGFDAMNKDHTPSGYFTENGKEFSYPNLSMSDYKN